MSTARRTRASSSTIFAAPHGLTEPPADRSPQLSDGLTHCLTRGHHGRDVLLIPSGSPSTLRIPCGTFRASCVSERYLLRSAEHDHWQLYSLWKGRASDQRTCRRVYGIPIESSGPVCQKPHGIPRQSSLMCPDLIQTTGTSMDIKWIQEGKVEAGHFCSAQGDSKLTLGRAADDILCRCRRTARRDDSDHAHLGQPSNSRLWQALTIHTFLGIWFGDQSKSLTLSMCVVSGIWLFVTAFVAITVPNKPNYETPTPVRPLSTNHRIILTLALSSGAGSAWAICRSALRANTSGSGYGARWPSVLRFTFPYSSSSGLISRSRIPPSPGRYHSDAGALKRLKPRLKPIQNLKRKPGTTLTTCWLQWFSSSAPRNRMLRHAVIMYLLTYSIIILPLSIVRWITFSGRGIL
jgi:hypothetical protein